ncbi:MAG: WD40 repeat domain-containing protein [Candidatus Omnitrophota bacterium]
MIVSHRTSLLLILLASMSIGFNLNASLGESFAVVLAETPTETPNEELTATQVLINPDVPAREPIAIMGMGVVNRAVYSPDRRFVAVASNEGAFLWNVENDQPELVYQLIHHTAKVNDVVFSRDGEELITVNADKTIKIWDAVTGLEKQILTGHQAEIICAALSPDGNWFLTGSLDKSVKLWDAESKDLICTFEGLPEGITSLAIAPEGNEFLTGGQGGSIQRWNVITRKQSGEYLTERKDYVHGLAYSPDGEQIAALIGNQVIYLLNRKTGATIYSEGYNYGSFYVMAPKRGSVVFSPDGRYLLNTDNSYVSLEKYGFFKGINGQIALRNSKTGELISRVICHPHFIYSASFSPDGRRIITGSYDTTCRIIDVESWQEIGRLGGHAQFFRTYAYYIDAFKPRIDFSSDGEKIISAAADNSVMVWDAQTGKKIKSFDRHGGTVYCAVFSHDGKYVATGGADYYLRIWNYLTGEETVAMWNGYRVFDCDFSQHDAWIVANKRLWDVKWGQLIQTYDVPETVNMSKISNSMQWILAGYPNGLQINDLYSGEKILNLGNGQWGNGQWINTLYDISRDDRFLVTSAYLSEADYDNSKTYISIWNSENGECLKTWTKQKNIRVTSISFSPDGDYIAIGNNGGSTSAWVEIWNWKSDRNSPVWSFLTLSQITEAIFSPDGKRLASIDDYGRIFVWYVGDILFEPTPQPGEPTRTQTPIPTQTPTLTPTVTPTLSPTPTVIPSRSLTWTEFSSDSAKGAGLGPGSTPYGPLALGLNGDGGPVVGWSELFDIPHTYFIQWDGKTWQDMGTSLKEEKHLYMYIRVNRITKDPKDNKVVMSASNGKSQLHKFDGRNWVVWDNSGRGENDGNCFFADLAFLPDHSPLILFNHTSYYPECIEKTNIRLRKFDGQYWPDFNPGSAFKSGIADCTGAADLPQLQVTRDWRVYALWEQVTADSRAIFLKMWNTAAWVGLDGSAEGLGLAEEMGCLSPRALALDGEGQPIVAYVDGGRIYCQRYDKARWRGWENPAAKRDQLSESNSSSAVIVNVSGDYPVVIWHDDDSGALYAKQFDGQRWQPAGKGAASGNGVDLGGQQDAILDADGKVIVVYANAQGNIYLRRYAEPIPTVQHKIIINTPTPTLTPIPGWFVLDGYGGIHGSNPDIRPPVLPYLAPFDIVRDIEPDPQGRGWYMLDGYGGIHTSSPDLPIPNNLPYFGFDIARNLEIRNTDEGYAFYLLDGYGCVHTSVERFDHSELPWFGYDIARDLEPAPDGNGWYILDGFGFVHPTSKYLAQIPLGAIWEQTPLLRGMAAFPGSRFVLIDAYGGRHTNPSLPVSDAANGLPQDFYFPNFDIIWDIEAIQGK